MKNLLYFNVTKKRNALLSCILIFTLLISTALAFMTSTDSKINVFTVGDVGIELWENFNGVSYGPEDGNPPKLMNATPGTQYEKEPYVKNSGTADAYVYMTVGVPLINTATKTHQAVLDMHNLSSSWTDLGVLEDRSDDDMEYHLFSYNGVLEAGETTEALFDEVSIYDELAYTTYTTDPTGSSTSIGFAHYDISLQKLPGTFSSEKLSKTKFEFLDPSYERSGIDDYLFEQSTIPGVNGNFSSDEPFATDIQFMFDNNDGHGPYSGSMSRTFDNLYYYMGITGDYELYCYTAANKVLGIYGVYTKNDNCFYLNTKCSMSVPNLDSDGHFAAADYEMPISAYAIQSEGIDENAPIYGDAADESGTFYNLGTDYVKIKNMFSDFKNYSFSKYSDSLDLSAEVLSSHQFSFTMQDESGESETFAASNMLNLNDGNVQILTKNEDVFYQNDDSDYCDPYICAINVKGYQEFSYRGEQIKWEDGFYVCDGYYDKTITFNGMGEYVDKINISDLSGLESISIPAKQTSISTLRLYKIRDSIKDVESFDLPITVNYIYEVIENESGHEYISRSNFTIYSDSWETINSSLHIYTYEYSLVAVNSVGSQTLTYNGKEYSFSDGLWMFLGEEVIYESDQTEYNISYEVSIPMTVSIDDITVGSNSDYSKLIGKTVSFGLYPTTLVDDDQLISDINTYNSFINEVNSHYRSYSGIGTIPYITDNSSYYSINTDSNKWSIYKYKDTYYCKTQLFCYYPDNIHDPVGSEYSSLDENGYQPYTEYYFKMEPVQWTIVSVDEDGICEIIANKIIDATPYASSSYLVQDDDLGVFSYDSSQYYGYYNTTYVASMYPNSKLDYAFNCLKERLLEYSHSYMTNRFLPYPRDYYYPQWCLDNNASFDSKKDYGPSLYAPSYSDFSNCISGCATITNTVTDYAKFAGATDGYFWLDGHDNSLYGPETTWQVRIASNSSTSTKSVYNVSGMRPSATIHYSYIVECLDDPSDFNYERDASGHYVKISDYQGKPENNVARCLWKNKYGDNYEVEFSSYYTYNRQFYSCQYGGQSVCVMAEDYADFQNYYELGDGTSEYVSYHLPRGVWLLDVSKVNSTVRYRPLEIYKLKISLSNDEYSLLSSDWSPSTKNVIYSNYSDEDNNEGFSYLPQKPLYIGETISPNRWGYYNSNITSMLSTTKQNAYIKYGENATQSASLSEVQMYADIEEMGLDDQVLFYLSEGQALNISASEGYYTFAIKIDDNTVWTPLLSVTTSTQTINIPQMFSEYENNPDVIEVYEDTYIYHVSDEQPLSFVSSHNGNEYLFSGLIKTIDSEYIPVSTNGEDEDEIKVFFDAYYFVNESNSIMMKINNANASTAGLSEGYYLAGNFSDGARNDSIQSCLFDIKREYVEIELPNSEVEDFSLTRVASAFENIKTIDIEYCYFNESKDSIYYYTFSSEGSDVFFETYGNATVVYECGCPVAINSIGTNTVHHYGKDYTVNDGLWLTSEAWGNKQFVISYSINGEKHELTEVNIPNSSRTVLEVGDKKLPFAQISDTCPDLIDEYPYDCSVLAVIDSDYIEQASLADCTVYSSYGYSSFVIYVYQGVVVAYVSSCDQYAYIEIENFKGDILLKTGFWCISGNDIEFQGFNANVKISSYSYYSVLQLFQKDYIFDYFSQDCFNMTYSVEYVFNYNIYNIIPVIQNNRPDVTSEFLSDEMFDKLITSIKWTYWSERDEDHYFPNEIIKLSAYTSAWTVDGFPVIFNVKQRDRVPVTMINGQTAFLDVDPGVWIIDAGLINEDVRIVFEYISFGLTAKEIEKNNTVSIPATPSYPIYDFTYSNNVASVSNIPQYAVACCKISIGEGLANNGLKITFEDTPNDGGYSTDVYIGYYNNNTYMVDNPGTSDAHPVSYCNCDCSRYSNVCNWYSTEQECFFYLWFINKNEIDNFSFSIKDRDTEETIPFTISNIGMSEYEYGKYNRISNSKALDEEKIIPGRDMTSYEHYVSGNVEYWVDNFSSKLSCDYSKIIAFNSIGTNTFEYNGLSFNTDDGLFVSSQYRVNLGVNRKGHQNFDKILENSIPKYAYDYIETWVQCDPSWWWSLSKESCKIQSWNRHELNDGNVAIWFSPGNENNFNNVIINSIGNNDIEFNGVKFSLGDGLYSTEDCFHSGQINFAYKYDAPIIGYEELSPITDRQQIFDMFFAETND